LASFRHTGAALAFACLISVPAFAAEPLLNPIFQDHAVVQRDKPIHVWGHAGPGADVTVMLSNASVQAHADSAGRWSADLPAMPAGGPYTLTATAGPDSETLKDVLVGDVWLCSGQSNMALPVKAAIDSGADIAISANDSIRLMTVANETSASPLESFKTPIVWQAASPKSVPDFSAACYYFARDLQKSVNVPMGLMQSAWSGANISSFISEDKLQKLGGYDERLKALQIYATDQKAAFQYWGGYLEGWWRSHLSLQNGSEPWTAGMPSGSWSDAPAGLGVWSEWNDPVLKTFTGNVWFRTTVNLTAAQASQPTEMSLGNINEEDETWVDGAFIANTFGYAALRQYQLPAGTLHEGANTIVVNVLCTWRGCGMFGPDSGRVLKLPDGSTVPLQGWKYQIAPAGVSAPRAPWGGSAGTGVVYNAMLAPLMPYGMRGVTWYQGESNTGDPVRYRALLAGMMADWRQASGTDLPFIIVQLPDYGVPPIEPEKTSDWAPLRESERTAVADDSNAALVVTIDIGSHYGLHPADKPEVGRRMSMAARKLVYGDTTAPTSPAAVSARRERNAVVVEFKDVDQGLVAYDAVQPIGFELCQGGDCRFATAHIRKDTVRLDVPARLRPTHVRYCWANGPVCTLYDGARLPAGPFDLPIAYAAKGKPIHRRPRKH
jgi:sialate O-acetylesterase